MKDFGKRARACGITESRWPYGANSDQAAAERLILWAEETGVKHAYVRHRCLDWLRNGRCRRVEHAFGGGPWDHVSCWTFNGAPALLLAQPYSLVGDDIATVAELTSDRSLLVMVRSNNWYGNGTVGVEIWNRSVREAISEARKA